MEIRPSAQQYLPPVVKNLLIINVLVFIAEQVIGGKFAFNPVEHFAMFYVESPLFKPWQLITHMFMHANMSHILFNMFALWMFGTVLEQRLGSKRFLQFYILAGLGAAACHIGVQAYEFHQLGNIRVPYIPTVGASGAIYGLLFAFGFLFPESVLHLYFFIPVKAKYFIAILAIIGLVSGISNQPGDNTAHFAHLGGMLAGFIIFKFWRIQYNSG